MTTSLTLHTPTEMIAIDFPPGIPRIGEEVIVKDVIYLVANVIYDFGKFAGTNRAVTVVLHTPTRK